MKRTFRFFTCFALLLCLMLPCAANASADKTLQTFGYAAADTENGSVIHMQTANEENWLFLPSSADKAAMRFVFDAAEGETVRIAEKNGHTAVLVSGEAVDLSEVLTENDDGVCKAKLFVENGEKIRSTELNIMFSANIRSMYITSADPENAGRDWVEKNKENKAKGNGLVLLGSDGEVIFDGAMKNMKGRGNSTWGYKKKPYQIKLKKSADLLENGEKADTWVLLANVCDGAMSRTNITYALADAVGLAYTPNGEYTDLYYDGEYRGTYLLAEKTEIGENRIEIRNLESEIADLNTEDVESMPTAQAYNSYGCKFQYVEGAQAPEDVSGGYLLERDYPSRALAETSWFTLRNGQYVVVKSPEFAPYEAVKYISEYYQGFEDAVDNGGVDPRSGRSLSDYIDMDSLVKCIIIQEFSKNGDAFESSAYFYKDVNDKMYAGPIWDFDSCYGSFYEHSLQEPEGEIFGEGCFLGKGNLAARLLKIPEVRAAIRKYCEEQFIPLVRRLTLGGKEENGSIRYYTEQVYASQRMNYKIWSKLPFMEDIRSFDSGNFDGYVSFLLDFVRVRTDWMEGAIRTMGRDCRALALRTEFQELIEKIPEETKSKKKNPEPVYVWEGGEAELLPEYEAFVSLEENTWTHNEDGSAVLTVKLVPYEGIRFAEDLKITVNGGECAWSFDENGVLTATIRFEAVDEGENPFADVKNTDWYYNSILEAYRYGLMNGVDTEKFLQSGKFSRAMLVTVLWRMEGEPKAGECVFTDVAPEAWFAGAVAWANENGIVTGVGDGLFAPNADVTREQLMCVLQRYAEYRGLDTAAEDRIGQAPVSDWARDSVNWAINMGLYDFAGNGELRAADIATRAEVAWVMIRAAKLDYPEPVEPEVSETSEPVIAEESINE